MKLRSDETQLVGRWIEENGALRGDTVSERIKWLTSQHLKKIDVSKRWGAWETLFQDPDDGRYWEHTYPQGEMQGGGPPALRQVSIEEAQAKYDLKGRV
jgi:hypothetical protein